MSDKRIKEIFLEHFTKQYGEEAAAELLEDLPNCNYAKAIAEAAYRETLKMVGEWLVANSYQDSANRRFSHNPAYDRGIGYSIWDPLIETLSFEEMPEALNK